MVNGYIKGYSMSLVTMKMHLKTIMRYHLTPIKMTIIKKIRHNKCWWGCREREPLYTVARNTSSEKAMAPHSSTLAWKIPWMEEPGGLQSIGLLRVGHDWATSLSLFTFMHWRRKWQPTPVFLPAESQGWGSLVGCHLWGHTELDTNEAT